MVIKNEINPRDIVLANPMYPDQVESKIRPLLVISKSLFHQNGDFFICVGITTNKTTNPYLIPLPRKQVENGQLDYDCQIMCNRIVTLNYNTITRKVAKITKNMYKEVTDKINKDILEL